MEVIGIGLLVIFIMVAVAFMILIVLARFMPMERARKVAIFATATLGLPVLVPNGIGYGLAFLAGLACWLGNSPRVTTKLNRRDAT